MICPMRNYCNTMVQTVTNASVFKLSAARTMSLLSDDIMSRIASSVNDSHLDFQHFLAEKPPDARL